MAEYFDIEGLSGRKVLEGRIRTHGAKNAALKILAAAPLFTHSLALENVPLIEDIGRMIELLGAVGARVEKTGPRAFRITLPKIFSSDLPQALSQTFRASIVMTGPLLARLGEVSFYMPGGCRIGKRPVDFFIEGFEAMGAEVLVSGSDKALKFLVRAKGGKLRGAEIFLRAPSVTATETLMMTGVLAAGRTVIKNAAMEPEIVSLADFLKSAGARIEGAGTPRILIQGGGSCRSLASRVSISKSVQARCASVATLKRN
jgi:UDP-N-acetylglucosamine 1-carboxyvinyltransferase